MLIRTHCLSAFRFSAWLEQRHFRWQTVFSLYHVCDVPNEKFAAIVWFPAATALDTTSHVTFLSPEQRSDKERDCRWLHRRKARPIVKASMVARPLSRSLCPLMRQEAVASAPSGRISQPAILLWMETMRQNHIAILPASPSLCWPHPPRSQSKRWIHQNSTLAGSGEHTSPEYIPSL